MGRGGHRGAPRLLIVYTGGTIGMTTDRATGSLVPYDFDHLMDNVPKVARLGYALDSVSLERPIDSSDAGPALWKQVASVVADAYDDYDGFVVLHGTDTMAYTASALSFMLGGLAKPVVLTGSQLPIGEIREDGTENLLSALQVAAAKDPVDGGPMVREVAIAFGRHLWRGNRATKVSSTDFGAFKSYNYPALGSMDLTIKFTRDVLWRAPGDGPLTPYLDLDDRVAVAYLYPGMNRESLACALGPAGTRVVVLRTFGSGNAPTEPWFTETVADAVASGKVVVNVTQCPAGGVEADRYASGDALVRAGVVSGRDMTCEATIAKAMHLLGRGLSPRQVGEYLPVPMVGELTV